MRPLSFPVAVALFFASASLADGRKYGRVPACGDPRIRKAQMKGDPVIMTGTNTMSYDWHEDVRVQMPNGRFSFFRSFISDLDALGQLERRVIPEDGSPVSLGELYCSSSVLSDLHPPFGVTNRNHTHNLQSLVDTRCPRSTRVFTPDGDVRFFGPLPSVPINTSVWVPRLVGEGAGEPSRLKVSKPAGVLVFEWFSESGESFTYRFLGPVYRLVLARSAENTPLYSVQYQDRCGQFEPSTVTMAESRQTIQFGYASCRLSGISMGARTMVTYEGAVATFAESGTPGGWTDQIGLISKRENIVVNGVALHPPEDSFQCPGCVPVGAGVSTEVRHVHVLSSLGNNIPSSTEGWGAALPTSFQALRPALVPPPSGSQCLSVAQSRSAGTFVAGGSVGSTHLYAWGDAVGGADFFTATGIGASYTPLPLSVSKTCSGFSDPALCQPGSVDFYYGRPTSDGLSVDLSCGVTVDAPTALVAVKDQVGSFSVSPRAFSTAAGGNFEDRASYEGATNPQGLNALSTTWRSFNYSNDRQELTTEEETSALQANQRAITTRRHDASGRLIAIVRSGYKRDVSSGAIVLAHQAVFFRHGTRCEGFSEPVARSRVSSVEGPCGVSDVTATTCGPGNDGPVMTTDLYYYDTQAPARASLGLLEGPTEFFNDGRLALARTFPQGCNEGTFLDTKFASYTAEGMAQRVVTPDGVAEQTATSGKLTTHSSGKDSSKQTAIELSWDRGNLQKVRYANGDFWRACYGARNMATMPSREQTLWFPDCPKVDSPGFGGVVGRGGRGGSGRTGTVGIGGGSGNAGGNGNGNGNGGVGNGNGIGNQPQGGLNDTMGQPLWVGRFSADGTPREHYSLQYSADGTLARIAFYDDPFLVNGDFGFTHVVPGQGLVQIKPVWWKTIATDSDRKVIGSIFADKIPTALGRNARGDITAMGSGFDFADPTMPASAQLSCLGTGGPFCKQLMYDRLGRLAGLTQATSDSSECLTYDPQGNLSGYARGCAPFNCAASPPTGVALGSNGALTVTGAPTCSASPITYVHDDFGDLISITQQHGPSPSETRIDYDGRGQVLRRRTAQQRLSPDPFAGTYEKTDGLNRTVLVAEWPPTHGAPLVQRFFDDAPLPTVCQDKFGPRTFTAGRLAFERSPLWNIWYSYNALGQVVSELRLSTAMSDCTAHENQDMNFTSYVYGYRGRLEQIRYPFGRRVQYKYPPFGGESGRDPERPNGIDVEVFGPGVSVFVPMVTDISWSRDGLLTGYRAATFQQPVAGFPLTARPPTNMHSVVYEYAGGSDAESPPASCASSPSAGSDGTRRLRRIRAVSDTTGVLSDQWYSWTGDQVTSVDKCYSGMTTPLTEFRVPAGERGFNFHGELTASTIPTAGGGLESASRRYAYDNRGNLRQVGFGTPVPGTNDGNGVVSTLVADRLESTVEARVTQLAAAPLPDTKEAWSYGYDLDGRLTTMTGANDSTGQPNSVTRFIYPYAGLAGNGGDGSVVRAVTVSGLTYNYYYDGSNRRVRKQHPTGAVEDYFYNPRGELLSERSFTFATNSRGNTVDEYIWLNGQPIASIRSLFLGDMTRAAEWDGYTSPQGGVCPRRNENARCGLYWLNPDRMGRPTFAIDKNFQLSGVGEYDAFGSMNRVELHRETPHPHAVNQTYMLAEGVTREKLGTALRARARISFADAPADVRNCGAFSCITPSTLVVRNHQSGGILFSTIAALGRSGAFRTSWFPVETSFDVAFISNPGTVGDGIVLNGWDYQRTAIPNATSLTSLPYFPPLRFPGQYYDEETGLHENWNRYYDPRLGRYLSPEPLLQQPDYVRLMAQSGMSVPTYAYAANNPLKYSDPDGLRIVWNQSDGALNRQVSRLRSTRTGAALFDFLDARPEVVNLKDLGGIRWRADGSWLAGGTNPGPNGGSECSAITHRSLERARWTDKSGRRWPMDPAAILGHELVHAMDNIFDATKSWPDETYPLEIQERIQTELETAP